MEPSSHPVVCFGEVLWDILPTGPLPGGAPMNVAYHLKKLGTNPALITRVGLDKYGEALVDVLSKSGVKTDYLSIDDEHPTGLVYANLNDHHEVVYDIVSPSAWDFIELNEEMIALVSQADYFVFGSLTSRSRVSRDTVYQLLDIAKTKVLDINLRPPHFRRPDTEHLLTHADVLKMNLAELELITGWFSNFQTTEDRMRTMQEKFDIETLIVTLGGDGALVNHQGTIYRHPGFKVKVEDTIGSGDSFLAGFLHQLLNGAPIESALAFASAIGAFIATQKGACPQYEMNHIVTLMIADSSPTIETNSNY
jgi:fructokinase